MSKYTTQLRYLVETGYDIGLSDYPIFDENYRGLLNQKIYDHYKFREIGAETPALFVHYLKTKMNEIMPYYNQVYKSTLLEYDPLTNYSLTEEYSKHGSEETNTEGKNKSIGSGKSATRTETENANESEQVDDLLNVQSDTPNGLLAIADIKTNTFASQADRSDNTSTVTGTQTGKTDNYNINAGISETDNNILSKVNTLDDYIRKTYGTIGVKTMQAMLLEFRDTFVNVDLDIINDLSDCFMLLW